MRRPTGAAIDLAAAIAPATSDKRLKISRYRTPVIAMAAVARARMHRHIISYGVVERASRIGPSFRGDDDSALDDWVRAQLPAYLRAPGSRAIRLHPWDGEEQDELGNRGRAG
jgi:hypothetical protein